MYIPVRVAVGILTACCCSVVGCTALFHPASESVVILSGRVADVQPSSMCNLYLYKENGKLARQATVASEFKTSLTIAPFWRRSMMVIPVNCVPGTTGSATA